jgi:hypothetical protein
MRAGLRAICVAATLALCACGGGSGGPKTSALTCDPLDAGTCDTDGPTYEANIQPILARSCLPACHDGSPDAAWPLTDFDDITAWTTYIQSDMINCTMPPADAGLSITTAERTAIVHWLGCGHPQ